MRDKNANFYSFSVLELLEKNAPYTLHHVFHRCLYFVSDLLDVLLLSINIFPIEKNASSSFFKKYFAPFSSKKRDKQSEKMLEL